MFPLVVSAAIVFAGGVLVYVRRMSALELTAAAYILENQVTHARLLPKPSAHAFTYSTLAFLVSLDALESHSLDLARGWLFGYGGTSWRVTGLRRGAYLLSDEGRSIKEKLRELLEQCGHDGGRLGAVWMMTMPSYLGYEGINPLTVHYCYAADTGGTLGWVVLEIHNTFGEKHVHVLEPGKDEDVSCPTGYEHQWTFARDFHVSPFNDRLGHYTVSVHAPPPPDLPGNDALPAPRPKIRIHLHAAGETSTSVGALKLTATLLARRAVPLTAPNLVHALARHPFALLLSFVRVLYHAWILHYVKLLDVFPRPDPKPPMRAWGRTGTGSERTEGGGRVYGGIGWQEEGPLEGYARRTVGRFLARRAAELGVTVTVISSDPSVSPQTFSGRSSQGEELVIHYAALRFFSTVLVVPSAEHMLMVGRTEGLFRVSSEVQFCRVFGPPCVGHTRVSLLQRVRSGLLPRRFVSGAAVPGQHPVDVEGGALNGVAVWLMHLGDYMEKKVFTLVRARFVGGTEPWGRWERAAREI